MSSTDNKLVLSPCIGQCSTTLGDDVCNGCGRTFFEVCNWNRFTNEQKIAVNERLRRCEGDR